MAKPDAASPQLLLDQVARASAAGYRFYVYELADSDGVFYVGKGSGRRLLTHGKASDSTNDGKLLRIQRAGQNLERRLVAFFQTSAAALRHEAERIAVGTESLTNIQGGTVARGSDDALKDRAQRMLNRIVPRGLYRAPSWIDQQDALALYDLMVESLRRQITCPSPTSITLSHSGELIAKSYA